MGLQPQSLIQPCLAATKVYLEVEPSWRPEIANEPKASGTLLGLVDLDFLGGLKLSEPMAGCGFSPYHSSDKWSVCAHWNEARLDH